MDKWFANTLPWDYWDSWSPALNQIEGALAIIAACIPTLKPVVAALVPSLFNSTNPANYGSENFVASRTFGGGSVTRPGHTSVVPNAFVLQNMGHTHTTIRAQRSGQSLDDSEEESMTANGIVRRTQVSWIFLSLELSIHTNSRDPELTKVQVDVSYDVEMLSAKGSSDELYKP